MPQLLPVTNKHINIRCYFEGFRKCCLLSWIPYMTGSIPKIHISVKSDTTIKRIIVTHYGPRHNESCDLQPIAEQGFEPDILREPGVHSYGISVQLENGISCEGIVLQAGKIFLRDDVIRNLLVVLISGVIIGRIIIPYIEQLIKRLIN